MNELEAIEARRTERKKATETAKAAQYVLDMTALDKLEEEHGETNVKALHVNAYAKGLPTFVVVKSSGGTGFYKRFTDQVRKAKGNKDLEAAAQDQLARASIAYPEPEVVSRMFEAFPNMFNDVAQAAVDFVKLEDQQEKKG